MTNPRLEMPDFKLKFDEEMEKKKKFRDEDLKR